jgi:hypothetical protein
VHKRPELFVAHALAIKPAMKAFAAGRDHKGKGRTFSQVN